MGRANHRSTGPRADAVLAASIFHYGEFTVSEAKAAMAAAGIEIRNANSSFAQR